MESVWNLKMKTKKQDGCISQNILNLFGVKLSFYHLPCNDSRFQNETGTECYSKPLAWLIFNFGTWAIYCGASAIPSTGIVLLAIWMKQWEKLLMQHCVVLIWKRKTHSFKVLSSLKIAGTVKQKKDLLPAFVHM